ncbi:NAD(P)/FAD-dependent oxidoreductase [Aspergillus udagawae]|uniref:FAD/NAD(P)-binding domain-containing protein n=1 Tax=Aspergillus udagawae TaxID=91492 RepID=A0A8E0QZU8_9EURO|nr:uncharacterized protein Aud_008795 [Aspergillus udagawae]GIC92329.1 hypothetical protein Aud_008795 [Aspergillus udagawae]
MSSINVVIIGASFAGINVGHSLLKGGPIVNIKVVLINPSTNFYFPIIAPRIFAKPDAFRSEQYLFPIKDLFARYPSDSFEFIIGTATNIDVTAKMVCVTINGGQDSTLVAYDYLVIASGSTTDATTGSITGFPIPFKQSGRDDMMQLIEAAQKQIAGASKIVIGGAGPIGVELAGELAEAADQRGNADETSITLVSASDRVLPTLKLSASNAGQRLLELKKVKIISSTRVVGVQASTDNYGRKIWVVSLDNGDKLSADLYIPTTGVVPNNNFIPPQFLDSSGWVKVDKELRVQSSGSSSPLPIYAAGDITTNTMRLSFKAREQAAVVGANLKSDILGKGCRKTYDEGESVVMFVPVGESGGTGQLFGMTIWSFLVRLSKGRDFFISKARSAVAG